MFQMLGITAPELDVSTRFNLNDRNWNRYH